MQGLPGKKIGMSRVFDEDGRQLVVTAIRCGPCVVLQRKRMERDGYDAVQLGFGDTVEKRLGKAEAGIFGKLNVSPVRHRFEFGLDAGEEYSEGDVVSVSVFDDVRYVDVVGTTKGKGFQGVVRRHGMAGGRESHGSHSRRRPGAVSGGELPGRIYKGKKMPGQMGSVRRTVQNLRVIRVLGEDNVLLVKGCVPGHAGSLVTIKRSVKKGVEK